MATALLASRVFLLPFLSFLLNLLPPVLSLMAPVGLLPFQRVPLFRKQPKPSSKRGTLIPALSMLAAAPFGLGPGQLRARHLHLHVPLCPVPLSVFPELENSTPSLWAPARVLPTPLSSQGEVGIEDQRGLLSPIASLSVHSDPIVSGMEPGAHNKQYLLNERLNLGASLGQW